MIKAPKISCKGTKSRGGEACSKHATPGYSYCWYHRSQATEGDKKQKWWGWFETPEGVVASLSLLAAIVVGVYSEGFGGGFEDSSNSPNIVGDNNVVHAGLATIDSTSIQDVEFVQNGSNGKYYIFNQPTGPVTIDSQDDQAASRVTEPDSTPKDASAEVVNTSAWSVSLEPAENCSHLRAGLTAVAVLTKCRENVDEIVGFEGKCLPLSGWEGVVFESSRFNKDVSAYHFSVSEGPLGGDYSIGTFIVWVGPESKEIKKGDRVRVHGCIKDVAVNTVAVHRAQVTRLIPIEYDLVFTINNEEAVGSYGGVLHKTLLCKSWDSSGNLPIKSSEMGDVTLRAMITASEMEGGCYLQVNAKMKTGKRTGSPGGQANIDLALNPISRSGTKTIYSKGYDIPMDTPFFKFDYTYSLTPIFD